MIWSINSTNRGISTYSVIPLVKNQGKFQPDILDHLHSLLSELEQEL